jgi:hypothetical protein
MIINTREEWVGCMEDLRIEKLHVWGDNPFEAEFGIRDLLSSAEKAVGWKVTEGLNFEQGFIPVATIQGEGVLVKMEGFGNYRQWNHLPHRLDTILGDGKVDQVFLYPDSDTIDLAIEDSSATMTGNQFQQRIERIAGFAVGEVPTAYLVPGYAIKAADGGIRSPNIWAEITALQLITSTRLPHLVFYFGTRESPDNKHAGQGAEALSNYRWARLLQRLGLKNNLYHIIRGQILIMLKQISARHDILFDIFPEWDDSLLEEWADSYANLSIGNPVNLEELPFNWGDVVPAHFPDVRGKELVNIGLPLAISIGHDIAARKACFPIAGKSKGRPPSDTHMRKLLQKQIKISNDASEYLHRPYSITEANQLLQQGLTDSGNVSPTVLEKGIVRYDKFGDFRKTLQSALEWMPKGMITSEDDDMPAIVFIASNVVDNFLRDPYAGMLASYAISFGAWDPRQETIVVLYCPWQSAMIAHKKINGGLEPRKSKTTAAWLRFANLTIFHDAVIKGVI